MYGRRTAVLLVAFALITGLYLLSVRPAPAGAAEMCEPVTIDILFPTTTLPPETTSPPEPDTTVPPTTGVAETTTTAAPMVTATTVAETTTAAPSTTTTAPPETTTTPVAESTTTAAPIVTTTTVAETTTAAPATTTTGPPETTTPPPPPACVPFVYDMGWPVAGPFSIGSPFGADRDGGARKHLGNDIGTPKLTPVLAVADGLVAKVVQNQGTSDCCYVLVEHSDGWQSNYIHLNNDLYGTDDGLGIGVRPDLVEGSPVARGEVIGWVGDSGNAEETVNHLHFELHTPEGVAVDPRPSLVAAFAATDFTGPQPDWPYADDDGGPAEEAAALLLTQGVMLACDGSMMNLCPDEVAEPDLAAAVGDFFAHKVTPRLEGRQLRDPAISGCPPTDDCVMLQGLTEADLARLVVWIRIDALVSTLRPKIPSEEIRDVMLPSPADADAQLRDIGAREFCNPPLDEVRVLTRGEAVGRLAAWMSGKNPEPCPPRGL